MGAPFNGYPSPIYYEGLASRFGVSIATPEYSGRLGFYERGRVAAGQKIEKRLEAVGQIGENYPYSEISNMEQLKQRELELSPEYIARLELIKKNDLIALQLLTKINNQRIADELAEKQRLEFVAEKQRLAAIKAENLRLEVIEDKEIQRLEVIEDKEIQRALLTSILPIGIIGLLLYSRTGRK
tara:strand:- start:642 stop:1193 length:552 start_codon:yes stop_codon:yes gene_type:complete